MSAYRRMTVDERRKYPRKIQARREEIKRATLRHRRKWNIGAHGHWPWPLTQREEYLLSKHAIMSHMLSGRTFSNASHGVLNQLRRKKAYKQFHPKMKDSFLLSVEGNVETFGVTAKEK